jgi:hypothetical protein
MQYKSSTPMTRLQPGNPRAPNHWLAHQCLLGEHCFCFKHTSSTDLLYFFAVVSVAVLRCNVQVSVSAYHQHHNHNHHNSHNHHHGNNGHNSGRQQRFKDSKGLRELKVKQNKHILSTYNKAYDVFPKVGVVAVALAAACLNTTSHCHGCECCSNTADSRLSLLWLNCTLAGPLACPCLPEHRRPNADHASAVLFLLCCPGQVCPEAQQPPG